MSEFALYPKRPRKANVLPERTMSMNPQMNFESEEARRERLVLENLGRVRNIAQRIHLGLPPWIPLDDLIHAGVLGLIDAVRKFDPQRNVTFGAYAEYRIRGAILDSLRQADWGSRKLRRQARQLEFAIRTCEARFGRRATAMEIAAELNISIESFHVLARELDLLTIQSLESDKFSEERIDDHGNPTEEDPYYQTLRSELMELVMRTIQELPENHRRALLLRYFKELPMKTIGASLGISESRVSQILSATIAMMRSRLGAAFRLNARTRGASIFDMSD